MTDGRAPLPASIGDTSSVELAEHLGKLAHELRTPLSAISAMAEIMRDERFGPLVNAKYAEYAIHIHDSARHLLAVVDSMLDESALAHGQAELTHVELDIRELLLTTVASLQPLATGSGLSLHLDLPPALPRLIADGRSVRQILLNLLTHALKFTPRGGSVVVSAGSSEDGLKIEVADTGPGLGDAPHACSGTGLGLPLARAMAVQNGATLAVTSEPGKGTCAAVHFSPSRVVPI